MLLDITPPQSIISWFFQLTVTVKTWIMKRKIRKDENFFLID
jgi:hypothetical protein